MHQPAAAANAGKGLLFHLQRRRRPVGGRFWDRRLHFLFDTLTIGRQSWHLTEGCSDSCQVLVTGVGVRGRGGRHYYVQAVHVPQQHGPQIVTETAQCAALGGAVWTDRGACGSPPPPGSLRWRGEVPSQCSLAFYFVVQSVRASGVQVPTLEIRDTFL